MSEHSGDGLFGGPDGTGLPGPLPDPSGRDGWRDAPELPPFALPPLPNTRLMREAIAAALGEDPTGLVDQDPGAKPRPAVPFNVAPPTVSQPTVVAPNVAPTNLTTPLPRPAPQVGGSSRASGRNVRPIVPAPVPSDAPPPRTLGGLRARYRPPLAAGSRTPVQLGDLRRRVSLQRPGLPLPLQSHSNGGAGVFFAISSALFVLLAYGVVTGIVDAIARLLP
ncbi:MAG: hypothetical protein DLM60_00185 [Pseudonocardiales bacterium]|nr:hypothetical protein [Actinomycetota bacterium]PZS24478.1 MAG: hypothetical protein DLM60_00185 [Pseudonocardiales bacterium]